MTPFHIAALSDRYKPLTFLYKHNSDINSIDQMDNTPLHLASKAGKSVVYFLLAWDHIDINR